MVNEKRIITIKKTTLTKNLSTGEEKEIETITKHQELKIGESWYSTARHDCSDDEVCGKCPSVSNCIFWKEMCYMMRE